MIVRAAGRVRWLSRTPTPAVRRRLGAVGVAFVVAASGVGATGAQAQTLPGAPTVRQVTEGSASLTVFWEAPADTGGSEVVSYDLRWIAAGVTDPSDSDWTLLDPFWSSGALSGDVTGLTNGTEYKLQVRAVTSTDGPWSQEASATPRILAPTVTAVVPGEGAITVAWTAPAEAAAATGVDYDVRWIRSDASDKSDNRWSLAEDVGASPAHHIIGGLTNGTGYDVQVRAVTDHDGSWSVTKRATPYEPAGTPVATQAEIKLDVPVAATINGQGDTDVFKLVLQEPTRVLVHTADGAAQGVGDTECGLINDRGTTFERNDDSVLSALGAHCVMHRNLDGGTYPRTYYISIKGSGSGTGAYVLSVDTVESPGDSIAHAAPIEVGEVKAGNHPVPFPVMTVAHYVQIVGAETSHLELVVAYRGPVQLTLHDADGNKVGAYSELILEDASFPYLGRVLKIEPTTEARYVKIERPLGGYRGDYYYTLRVDTERESVRSRCAAAPRPAGLADDIDPLYGCQWHLHNQGQFGATPGEDANVAAAHAAGYLGEGVHVSVIDTGIDLDHADLSDNTDPARSHSFCRNDSAAFSELPPFGFFTNWLALETPSHGTASAGLIAARDNSIGMRGVAPRAQLHNFRAVGCQVSSYSDLADAVTRQMAVVGVSLHNYGWDYASPWQAPAVWQAAVDTAATSGLNGKGVLIVKAAGNGGPTQYASLDEYNNHYAVVAVCAVDAHGRRSHYSERGSSLWVCAPSSGGTGPGVATTTLNDWYRDDYGGTSAAAPIVSGVAALVRGANSDLTARDVKLILAGSARRNHTTDPGWHQGAHQYRSDDQRYWFNHQYGFGVVDAHAAVQLADGWQNVPEMIAETVAATDTELEIPNNFHPVSSSVELSDAIEFVEHVEIDAHFDHPAFRNLQVDLVSPSGAVSALTPFALTCCPLTTPFTFATSKHLGEQAEGTWTLRTRHFGRSATGTLKNWSLTVRGHRLRPSAPRPSSISQDLASLAVTWEAPDHAGASEVTGYDIRYIDAAETDREDAQWSLVEDVWTAGPLTHTLSGLAGKAFDIEVRAKNDEGAGPWSTTVKGTPDAANSEPFYSTDAMQRSVAENTAVGEPIGDPVAAIDNDSGATLAYTLSGDDAEHFQLDGATAQLRTMSSLDHETTRSYSVRVSVSDGLNSAGTADTSVDDVTDVSIAVADVDEPFTLDCAADETDGTGWVFAELLVEPNSPPPVPEELRVGSCSVDDPEGAPAQWSLSGTDSARLHIDTGGVLGFVATPNFEEPSDDGENNRYEVTVEVDVGEHSETTTVSVRVTDADEPPTIGGEVAPALDEGGPRQVGTYTATDPEGETVTMSLGGTDDEEFTLAADGTLSFNEAADYESPADKGGDNHYELTINATDGTRSSSLDLTVSVRDANEAPTLLDRGCSFTVRENTSSAWRCTFDASDPERRPVRWSQSGTDAPAFSLSGGAASAVLQTRSGLALDYETQSTYSTSVRVTDHGGHFAEWPVTLEVTNVDEPGSVAVPLGGVVRVGTQLAAELSDPDGPTGETWQWQRRDPSWQDIPGATSQSYTPIGDDEGFPLRVTVSYTDGPHGAKELTSAATLAVAPDPGQNQAPEFTPYTIDCEVDEDRARGDLFGCVVTATDGDNDPVSYDLPGDAPFAVETRTGRIRLTGPLDHETQPQHRVNVVATDGLLSSNATVIIAVADIDEPGTITLDINGALRPGTTLNPSLADEDCGPSGCDAQWEWQRSDSGRDWHIIEASTVAHYTLTGADECHQIQIRAAYADSHRRQELFRSLGNPGEQVQPTTGQCTNPPGPVTVTAAGPGGGGGGGPAAVVVIEGASFAAAGSETVFTAAVSDDTTIGSLRWTVTGPDGFTATSSTQRFSFAVPAGGTYTLSVTIEDSAGGTLTGRVTLTVFGDITAHQFADEILWLAEEGITRGCAVAHSFCPSSPVTRAQMASFLARALDLQAPRQSAGFGDVDPSSAHAANIEALYAAQITTGCNQEPLQYCPSKPVTRAQMASFLARALDLETPRQRAGFDDVDPSSAHAANIEALYAAQITTGCTQDRLAYCPSRPVTRAQMAAFLARALNPATNANPS